MFIPGKLLNQIIWTHFVHSGKPQHWTATYPHVTTTQGCWDFPLESIGVYNQNVNMWSFFVVLWILELVWTLCEFPRVRNTAVLFLLKIDEKKISNTARKYCVWLFDQASDPSISVSRAAVQQTFDMENVFYDFSTYFLKWCFPCFCNLQVKTEARTKNTRNKKNPNNNWVRLQGTVRNIIGYTFQSKMLWWVVFHQ